MNRQWHLSQLRGYLELGMDREARRELRGLPESVREEPPFLALAMQLHQNAGRWPSAARIARKLMNLQPDEAGWWIALAYTTRRARTIESAQRILLRAEKRFPTEPTIQFNLACYAAQLGDLTEARTRLTRAISHEPGFARMAETDPDLEPMRESNG